MGQRQSAARREAAQAASAEKQQERQEASSFEALPAAPAAAAAPTYGTIEPSDDGKTLEWYSLGAPWNLLLTSISPVLKQCMTLGIIIVSVFFTHDNLMSCDSRTVGIPVATYCEYSKAYVRCFPLLALVIALMVSTRMFLQHRIYYLLLRCGVLLDIENFSPLSDPLFWVVVFCAVNGFGHYVAMVWTLAGLNLGQDIQSTATKLTSEDLYDNAEEASVFFIVPVALYLVYLFGAYDTEAALLPLSKYFEEDAEGARHVLAKMPFIQEPAAAAAVGLDMCAPAERHKFPRTTDQALAELVRRTQAREAAAAADPAQVPTLSRWRLMSTMWPAQLLLQARLDDEKSREFRRAWYCFCSVTVLVMLMVLYFIVQNLYDKIVDVFSGQPEDSVGVLVCFLHMLLNVYLIYIILTHCTIPFRT